MNSYQISVLLPLYKLFPLHYLVPKELCLSIGDLVIVPFRSKEYIGIVWELNPKTIQEKSSTKSVKLKFIIDKLQISISQTNIKLIQKAASYYLADLGSVAKLTLPVELLANKKETKTIIQIIPKKFNLSKLSIEQCNGLLALKESKIPTVLKGVTGSGKTELYFHLIADYLKNDNQVLILLPEIALSEQLVDRFKQSFNFEPVVWNASITKSKKQEALRGIITNTVKLVIGARSSLFLPYPNLELIIVDEEHDASYKQEDGVLYNARDMAVMRSFINNSKIILCSATPSIETIHNVQQKKYQLVDLPNRYYYAALPYVNIIDMKREHLAKNSWLSSVLIKEIRETINKKEQVLLFLNRRGYAPVILCKSCGYKFNCPNCSTWLVVHKNDPKVECHHCGYIRKIPLNCLECNEEDSLVACGPGIERIEEEVYRLFPDSRIFVISKDQASKPELRTKFLEKMANSEIDILIGTQVITKGYHFPNITLVGVIDADLGFMGADLRANERNYQLLHQVGGRAGREYKKGQVFLQTYYPDNLVLNSVKMQDEETFLSYEFKHRKENNMPPFSRIAVIVLKAKNEELILNFAKKFIQIAPTIAQKVNVSILGPAKAPIYKLSGKYRYKILIITEKSFQLQKYLSLWKSLIKIPSSINLAIDIDPQSFF